MGSPLRGFSITSFGESALPFGAVKTVPLFAMSNRKQTTHERWSSATPVPRHTSWRVAAVNVRLVGIVAVVCVVLIGGIWLSGLVDSSAPERSQEVVISTNESAPRTSDTTANNSQQATPDDQVDLTADFVTAKGRAKLDLLNRFVDPRQTEWRTEVFSEAANAQLALLSELLRKPNAITAAALHGLVTDDFNCAALRPGSLNEALRDASIVVRRFRAPLERRNPTESTVGAFRGADGAATALQELTTVFRGDPNPNVKLKVYRVEQQEQNMATIVAVEVGAKTSSGAVQINATWKCIWIASGDRPPRLISIDVQDYEEVVSTDKNHRWFVDCTEAVLAHNPSYREQLLYGIDTWVNRLDRRLTISRFGHHGIAVGDVNADGLDDIYVCQPGGLPNQLFVQHADGRANEISAVAGVDFLDYTYSAMFVDLDNDGDQDLIVAAIAALTV